MYQFEFFDHDSAEYAAMPPGNGPYIPDADECRRCGVCVGNCPTFRLFQTDEETPRRRIRSIEKLLRQQALAEEEIQHLQNCLQCRACESICPSRMAYGQLFDQAQAALQANWPWQAKLGFWLIEHKRWRKSLMPMISLYRRSGLQRLLSGGRLLKKLALADAERLLSEPALTALSGIYPAQRKQRGRVALFSGCLAEDFDRVTQRAAIKLLTAIGYEVVVPEAQGCCGAVHRHNGRDAADLIANNLQAFYALEVDAVLYSASGCGAMLADYPADDEVGGWFHHRLRDVVEFLLQHWPADLQPAASNLSVAVHQPCSQRNVLKNGDAVVQLLGKIPGLTVNQLPENQHCCGAGGTYLLSHPENAGRLRSAKRQVIDDCGADLVVSSNFGCALHLNAGQGEGKLQLLHPLQVLADRL